MDARSRDSSVEGATAQTRTAFVAALRDGDAKSASRVYADGAKLLAPSAELIKGLHAIEAFWQAGVDAGICDVELDAFELKRVGQLAYEIGCYTLRLQPGGGGTVVDRGKYLLIHERQADGSWGRAVEMFNPDATPANGGGRRASGAGIGQPAEPQQTKLRRRKQR